MQTNDLNILQQLYTAGMAVASELGRMWAPTEEPVTAADFRNALHSKRGQYDSHNGMYRVIHPANNAKNRSMQRLISDYRAAGEIDILIKDGSYEMRLTSSNIFYAIREYEKICKIRPKDQFRVKFQFIENTYIPTIMTKKLTDTPLSKQYEEMKQKHPDAVLLFRVGDFYETFKQDAVDCSEILGITLTRRANGKDGYIEIAGFPHNALEVYLPKLIRAGKRVAICEQLEDPKATTEPQEPQEPQPTAEAEPTEPQEPPLQAELRECAMKQLPDGAEVVATKYVPIGEDNGKLKMVIKMGGICRYADIVAKARVLYICDRVFFTTDEILKLMDMGTTEVSSEDTPEAAPEVSPEVSPEDTPEDTPEVSSEAAPEATDDPLVEMTKMFMDEYGYPEQTSKLQAECCFKLYRYLVENKSWTFKFRKKDGSERIAHGTLHPDVIPSLVADPTKPERKPNPKMQTYYDLDKQSWRCFEKANLIDNNVTE